MSDTSAWCAGPWKHSPTPSISAREGDDRERRSGREPVAARVDEQPGDGPERRHQRERAHPTASLDPARDRQLREHDRERVDEEDRADLMLAQVGLVAREGGEEGEERVPGRDEHEVEGPEAEERLVPQHGRVGRRGVSPTSSSGDPGIRHEEEHADVREERERVEHEEHRERGRIADDARSSPPSGRRARSRGSSSRAAARRPRVAAPPGSGARSASTGSARTRRCRHPRSRSGRMPPTARARAAGSR